MKEDWHKVITLIVKLRVSELDPDGRVDLFLALESQAPDLLTDVFMTEAATALDQLIFTVSEIIVV